MADSSSKPWLRWVVLGCSGLILVGALATWAFVSLVMGGVKKSAAFQGALDKAVAHPAVVAALGEPIEPGFWVSGSVSVEGPSGRAALAVPLSGPRGTATLYVEATKRAGRWEYALLELEVAGREARIDVLGSE